MMIIVNLSKGQILFKNIVPHILPPITMCNTTHHGTAVRTRYHGTAVRWWYPLLTLYQQQVTTLQLLGGSLSQPQQTRGIDPMLVYCCASVADGGPALNQHWVNAPCLLGTHGTSFIQWLPLTVLSSRTSWIMNNGGLMLSQRRQTLNHHCFHLCTD